MFKSGSIFFKLLSLLILMLISTSFCLLVSNFFITSYFDVSMQNLDFFLSDYSSKTTKYPKLQEVNIFTLSKCLFQPKDQRATLILQDKKKAQNKLQYLHYHLPNLYLAMS